MPTPDLMRTLPAGYKLGKGAWGQFKRRAVIRKALDEAAFLLMLRLKAPPEVRERFQRNVMRLLRSAGRPPTRMAPRLKAWFRGGPATLFDGPEARHWPAQVRDLGARAFDLLRHEDSAWLRDRTSEELGREYFDEVMTYVSDRAGKDDYAPEFAILAEQARAETEQQEIRRFSATRLRVTKIAFAVAVGAAVGHGVDQAVVTPDWIDTATVAVVGGALAAASTSQKQQADARITAEMSWFLGYLQRRLRTHLRLMVATFTSICVRDRAPPDVDTDSLRDPILDTLRCLSDQAHAGEIHLRISERQRYDLTRAAAALALEVETSDLQVIDPDTADAVTRLVSAVHTMFDRPCDDYEQQLELGNRLVHTLREALNVTTRIDSLMRKEPPEDPTGKVHLAVA